MNNNFVKLLFCLTHYCREVVDKYTTSILKSKNIYKDSKLTWVKSTDDGFRELKTSVKKFNDSLSVKLNVNDQDLLLCLIMILDGKRRFCNIFNYNLVDKNKRNYCINEGDVFIDNYKLNMKLCSHYYKNKFILSCEFIDKNGKDQFVTNPIEWIGKRTYIKEGDFGFDHRYLHNVYMNLRYGMLLRSSNDESIYKSHTLHKYYIPRTIDISKHYQNPVKFFRISQVESDLYYQISSSCRIELINLTRKKFDYFIQSVEKLINAYNILLLQYLKFRSLTHIRDYFNYKKYHFLSFTIELLMYYNHCGDYYIYSVHTTLYSDKSWFIGNDVIASHLMYSQMEDNKFKQMLSNMKKWNNMN